ncbi:hypothetical protein SBADM41S_00359 [Streptomyces badius]
MKSSSTDPLIVQCGVSSRPDTRKTSRPAIRKEEVTRTSMSRDRPSRPRRETSPLHADPVRQRAATAAVRRGSGGPVSRRAADRPTTSAAGYPSSASAPRVQPMTVPSPASTAAASSAARAGPRPSPEGSGPGSAGKPSSADAIAPHHPL